MSIVCPNMPRGHGPEDSPALTQHAPLPIAPAAFGKGVATSNRCSAVQQQAAVCLCAPLSPSATKVSPASACT